MSKKEGKKSRISLFYPIKPAVITQPFGVNGEKYRQLLKVDIKGHNGIDYRAYHKQPVYASHDGRVIALGTDSKAGWGVVLLDNSETFKTIYWHFVPHLNVEINERVKAGHLLGWADNTGISFGDHLHFGLKRVKKAKKGVWINANQDNGYFGAENPQLCFNGIYAQDIKEIRSLSMKLIEALRELIKIWRKLKQK